MALYNKSIVTAKIDNNLLLVWHLSDSALQMFLRRQKDWVNTTKLYCKLTINWENYQNNLSEILAVQKQGSIRIHLYKLTAGLEQGIYSETWKSEGKSNNDRKGTCSNSHQDLYPSCLMSMLIVTRREEGVGEACLNPENALHCLSYCQRGTQFPKPCGVLCHCHVERTNQWKMLNQVRLGMLETSEHWGQPWFSSSPAQKQTVEHLWYMVMVEFYSQQFKSHSKPEFFQVIFPVVSWLHLNLSIFHN